MPFGYWVVRLFKREDIRRAGSGNIGATNVWRTYGRWYGIPIVLLDVAKGFVPALVAALLVNDLGGVLAGGAAMLGHWRPLFLGFQKGGKMVATCGGVLFALAPWVGVASVGVWLVVFVVLRYSSLASIVAAIGLPVLAVLLDEPWPVVGFAAAAAAAVIVLHRANIGRLRAGTESRFSFRRQRGEVATP